MLQATISVMLNYLMGLVMVTGTTKTNQTKMTLSNGMWVFSSHLYFLVIYFIFTILLHILFISQHVSRQCHDTVTTLKFLDAFISLRSIIFKYICLYFAYYLRIAFHAPWLHTTRWCHDDVIIKDDVIFEAWGEKILECLWFPRGERFTNSWIVPRMKILAKFRKFLWNFMTS